MRVEEQKNGRNVHALFPRKILKHLPIEVTVPVRDYESQLVMLLRFNDFWSEQKISKMIREPEEGEINEAAAKVDLGEDWDDRFREQEKCDPSDDDREYCKRAAALNNLRAERRMLMELPRAALRAVRENKMDVCVVSLKAEEYGALAGRRQLEMKNLQLIDSAVKNRGMLSLAYGNYLTLTGKEPDGSYRWVCLVEWPGQTQKLRRERKDGKDNERGLVLVFPYEILIRALVTKVFWIAAMYPRLRTVTPEPDPPVK
jgi:hypothetical protein